jgi:hypothetical protein
MANFSNIDRFEIDNINDAYNIVNYFKCIDDSFILNKIVATDNEYRKCLVRHVCGPALLEIIRCNNYDAEDKTYAQFKEAVINHFSKQSNPVIANIQFDKTKINSGETFESYVLRLKIMAKSCNFGETLDQHILYKLIQEFPHTSAAKECVKKSDSKLANFIEYYTNERFQANHLAALSTKSNGIGSSEVNAISKNYQKQHSKKLCNKCNTEHEKYQCPAYGKKCNKCKQSNHFARCCTSMQRSNSYSNSNSNNNNRRSNYVRQNSLNSKNGNGNNNKNSNQNNHRSNMVSQQPAQVGGHTSFEDEDCYAIRGICCHGSKNHLARVCATCNDEYSKQEVGYIPINMFGVTKPFLIDTGSCINVIDDKTFNMFNQKPNLVENKKPAFGYGASSPLNIIGKFETDIKINSHKIKATFVVVKDGHCCILGKQIALDLNLIHFNYSVSEIKAEIKDEVQIQYDRELRHLYPNVYRDEIGKLKDFKLKFQVDDGVDPTQDKFRHTPFNLRDGIERELKEMIDNDIIERIDPKDQKEISWLSQIVPVKKGNNRIRICIDAKKVNKAIKRIKTYTPTVEDLCIRLNGSQFISKIDLRSAFNQIELDEESRYLTSFVTHCGVYRYKRLFFGITCAPEIFQQIIYNLIRGVNNSFNISDDIIIYGETAEQHDKALHSVLKILDENGLTINGEKCEWKRQELDFFGLHFSKDGVSLKENKVEALMNAKKPENKKEIHSFLGLGTYCSRFIHRYSDDASVLWGLTARNKQFNWNDEHEKAFNNIRNGIRKKCLAYYQKDWNTELHVDASPFGIAAVLVQVNPRDSDDKRIIAFASRCLSDIEKKYSQCEKEALAIVWACERFHLYLYGCKFKIYTDNQALKFIFNHEKVKPPPRIERWQLRLMPYNFEVIHKSGASNIADYLSRHPIEDKYNSTRMLNKFASDHINAISSSAPTCMIVSKDEIIKETLLDSDLVLLKQAIQYKGDKLDSFLNNNKSIQSYKKFIDEISVTDDGMVLRDHRIIIPFSLRTKIVDSAHDGHMGINRTKALIREHIWFPSIDNMVENKLKNCLACQANHDSTNIEPLIMSELPQKPWQYLSIDFYEIDDLKFLVLMDEFSRYPLVMELRSTSAEYVIRKLDKIFSIFGHPEKIKSDNGPPFDSKALDDYFKSRNIRHQHITPYWPRANGEAERFMRNLGNMFRKTKIEKKDWRAELNTFLRNYRSTPHPSIGVAPSSLVIKLSSPTLLPKYEVSDESRYREIRDQDKKSKESMKKQGDKNLKTRDSDFRVGDFVLFKHERRLKSDPIFSPIIYEVISVKGSMITAHSPNHMITRNSCYFKRTSIKPDYKQDKQTNEQEANIQQTNIKQPNVSKTLNRIVNNNLVFPQYNDDPNDTVGGEEQNNEDNNPVIGNNENNQNSIQILNNPAIPTVVDNENNEPILPLNPNRIISNDKNQLNDKRQEEDSENSSEHDKTIKITISEVEPVHDPNRDNLDIQNDELNKNRNEDSEDESFNSAASFHKSRGEKVDKEKDPSENSSTDEDDNLSELNDSYVDDIVSTPSSSSVPTSEDNYLRRSTTEESSNQSQESNGLPVTTKTKSGRVVKPTKIFDIGSGHYV